jgi:formate--tetrahydrofolate ligase
MLSDIEIAQAAKLIPIAELFAEKTNLNEAYLNQYGKFIAKVDLSLIQNLPRKGKLILVTSINPTAAGEGKTTTLVGLVDALNKLNKKTIGAMREPSLGPCFGVKGGACGGGYAQVVPMEDINLHFTGDFHAITSAHNLLAAMLDNHLYWGNKLNIDIGTIKFKRAMDMNDRALRKVKVDIESKDNNYSYESGFDITAASEVMAILCLSRSYEDLDYKLGNILLAFNSSGLPVYARDLLAQGAMSALLKNALLPNLVQTLENNLMFVHGGPFANIAHGNNSIIATEMALRLGDYVVTEAGFGADLGAEKFFDIKCREANFSPTLSILVCTVRALKMHGGLRKRDLSTENIEALKKGILNLERHIENLLKFSISVLVTVNYFEADTENELSIIREICKKHNVLMVVSKHWLKGSEGALELAKEVVSVIDKSNHEFSPLYSNNLSIVEKAEKIAKEIYRAEKVTFSAKAMLEIKRITDLGYSSLPLCIAKTQYSFSCDAKSLGAPINHEVLVKDIFLRSGAGMIVLICGDIMTMPGLPKVPAATSISLSSKGKILGLS